MQRTWKLRHVRMAGLCCGLGLLATGLSVAQQPGAERPARQQPQAQQQRQAQQQTGQKQFCLATELIGMTVKGQEDEAVGQIQNLIITQQGDVQYLALSGQSQSPTAGAAATDRATPDRAESRPQQARPEQGRPGSAAGQAGQLTLIPWELAEFHAGPTKAEGYVSVQIEKDRLMSAPSFGQEQLTSPQGQAQIIAQVDQFFNVRERRGAARPELNREREQRDDLNPRGTQPQRDQPQRDQPQPDDN